MGRSRLTDRDKRRLFVLLRVIHEFTAQNMKARHQIVTAIREILQNRRIGVLGRAKYPIETLLWSECGFDADTSPQVIESSIFGDSLDRDDLGTCMSCIAHLERMIDQVGPQRLDAEASPIPGLEGCYHKTPLSEYFKFARLGAWR